MPFLHLSLSLFLSFVVTSFSHSLSFIIFVIRLIFLVFLVFFIHTCFTKLNIIIFYWLESLKWRGTEAKREAVDFLIFYFLLSLTLSIHYSLSLSLSSYLAFSHFAFSSASDIAALLHHHHSPFNPNVQIIHGKIRWKFNKQSVRWYRILFIVVTAAAVVRARCVECFIVVVWLICSHSRDGNNIAIFTYEFMCCAFHFYTQVVWLPLPSRFLQCSVETSSFFCCIIMQSPIMY